LLRLIVAGYNKIETRSLFAFMFQGIS